METQLKKDAKHFFSKLGFMYLAGTLILIATQLIILNVIAYLVPNLVSTGDGAFLSSMLPMYIIGVPIMILLIRCVPSNPVPEKKKMSVGQWIVAFIISYACTYLGNIVGLILTGIIGILKNGSVQNALAVVASNLNPFTSFLVMVICAPVIEEIIFRKLLVDRVSKYGEKIAILLSGFIFGLFHANLNQFAYAFILGCFFAFIYCKTRNIIYTILLHMAINLLGTVVGPLIIKMTGYMDIATTLQSASPEEAAQIVSSNMAGIIIYFIYALLLLAMVITGTVLLIVKRKSFICSHGEIEIPKGQRFSVVILNAGMILYSVVWIACIILQLFQ